MRNDNIGSSLAKSALDEIPKPREDAKNIVGLVKESGKVVGYELSDNSKISKQDGVDLAKQGMISGVGIAHRNGTEYLKSIPDDTENNNLSNLPSSSPD